MKTKIKFIFKKIGKTYPILEYSGNELNNVTDMRDLVYTGRSIQSMIKKDGLYDLIGNIELKRVKYHVDTIMYGEILN